MPKVEINNSESRYRLPYMIKSVDFPTMTRKLCQDLLILPAFRISFIGVTPSSLLLCRVFMISTSICNRDTVWFSFNVDGIDIAEFVMVL